MLRYGVLMWYIWDGDSDYRLAESAGTTKEYMNWRYAKTHPYTHLNKVMVF